MKDPLPPLAGLTYCVMVSAYLLSALTNGRWIDALRVLLSTLPADPGPRRRKESVGCRREPSGNWTDMNT